MPEWGRVPKLTYARINLDAYLPHASRVIVLDSDVLVRTGIGRLWDTPLDGAVAAASVDPFLPTVLSADGPAQHSGRSPDAPYLNAGVQLVDLDLWRSHEIASRAIAYAVQNWRAAKWCDQDAINAVLEGRWKILDRRWQMQPRRAIVAPDAASEPEDDAWILHFSGRLKPWLYRGTSAADREFFEVLDRTAWSGWRPPASLRSLFLGVYERRLRRRLYSWEVRALNWLGRAARFRQALRSR